MEFRLSCEGALRSDSSAIAAHKREIRRVFHRQIKKLRRSNPLFHLQGRWAGKFTGALNPDGSVATRRVDELAGCYKRGFFNSAPILFDEVGMDVSPNI
jgi:hypothetical protein